MFAADDRFADESVSVQFLRGRLRFVAHYEGDTTTGSRVSRRTAGTARSAIRGSRARTTAGRRRAIQRAGVPLVRGRAIERTARARKLTPKQVAARTSARSSRRDAGSTTGRRRTRSVIRRARRQAR